MRSTSSSPLVMIALAVLLLPLTACGVVVHEDQHGRQAEVDVHTPLGGLSVHTGIDTRDTGLSVYPGARALRDDGHAESASVDLAAGVFGITITAAKFESDDRPDRLLAFYRNELKTFGDVTECRGNIDFKGTSGSHRPVCREHGWSREVQLVAGTEEDHRIVTVEPRGDGSEFAIVHLRTRT